MVQRYLNEFDWEFQRRGALCIWYADDIVLLAKSERAVEQLLESSTEYLEGIRKLRVKREADEAEAAAEKVADSKRNHCQNSES